MNYALPVCPGFLPSDSQWIAQMVHDTMAGLTDAPAQPQLDPTAVLDAYQVAGGPQIITREPGRQLRWPEFERASGRPWARNEVGWYDQAGDRIWLNLNREPQGLRWGVRWHELAHSTGAPHRLGRTDFLALKLAADARYPLALLKHAAEEMTAEFGAVLIGLYIGTFSPGQFAISADSVIENAWISPVAFDRDRMQELLAASAEEAAEAAVYVLAPACRGAAS
jgi:hypothetical protein